MNRRRLSLYLARPLTFLNVVMLIAVFCLASCSPACGGDCAPPPGTTPDATSLQVVNGTVYYMAKNTLFALDASTGKLLWKFATGEINQPVISNGVVYVNIDNLSNPGSSQFGEWVYALQGSNGGLLWHFRVAPYIAQIPPPPPQIIDGAVYAQLSGENYGSPLFALRASDGKFLWGQNPIGNNGESVTLLLAAHGIAYLSTYSSTTGYVTARNVSNSQLMWQYAIPHATLEIAAMLGNILYMDDVSTQGRGGWGSTYAFQANTGQVLWQSSYAGLPTVTQNAIYLKNNDASYGDSYSNYDYFYALQPNNGKLLWQLPIHGTIEDNIPEIWAANTDTIYATFGPNFNLTWYALDSSKGKPLWHLSTRGDRTQQIAESSLFIMQQWLLSGNSVYLPILSLDLHKRKVDFELHALQADTGKALWTFRHSAAAINMPYFTVVQGVIYLRTFAGSEQIPQDVWAIRAEDGKVLWHTPQTEKILSQVVSQDGVYLSLVKGSAYHFTYKLVALNVATGKQSWAFQA